MAIIPLISLGKYPFETGGVHHVNEKSECARRIRHRKETTGLSVGSNRVDMRKIPGMLRKHSLPRLQTGRKQPYLSSMETNKTERQTRGGSKSKPQLYKSIIGISTCSTRNNITICHSTIKLEWPK